MDDIPNKKFLETTEGRIAHVAEKIGKMSLRERLKIMVAAGLTTEASAQAALAREAEAKAKASVDAKRRKKTPRNADSR